MKLCDCCGRVAYDPNDTSDKSIADLALQKSLECLRYSAHVESQLTKLRQEIASLKDQLGATSELTSYVTDKLTKAIPEIFED